MQGRVKRVGSQREIIHVTMDGLRLASTGVHLASSCHVFPSGKLIESRLSIQTLSATLLILQASRSLSPEGHLGVSAFSLAKIQFKGHGDHSDHRHNMTGLG